MGVLLSKSSFVEYENLNKAVQQLQENILNRKKMGFTPTQILFYSEQLKRHEREVYKYKTKLNRNQLHKICKTLQKIQKQIGKNNSHHLESPRKCLSKSKQNNKVSNFSEDETHSCNLNFNEEINFTGPNFQTYRTTQDNILSTNFANTQNRDSKKANVIVDNADSYSESLPFNEDRNKKNNAEEVETESQNEEEIVYVDLHQQTNDSNKKRSQNPDISPETKKVREDPEKVKILNVHQYFQDVDFDSVDKLNFEERIEAIEQFAKDLESKVFGFEGQKYSLDYFVLDEKLMQLIEKLDKIKSDINSDTSKNKLRVINYINRLQSELDSRAKDDANSSSESSLSDKDCDELSNRKKFKTEDQNEELALVTPYQQTNDTGKNNETSSQNLDIFLGNQKVREDPEKVKILNVHQYFQDGDGFNSVDNLNCDERIEAIEQFAKNLETIVIAFEGQKFSLDYFVLDEKLMQLIEKLDKIKSDINSDTTKHKLRVIKYINRLQSVLDSRAKNDE